MSGAPSAQQRVVAWVERELGGTVVRAERQARWRPAWFLDLERDGETLPLYFRGERGETDHGVYALEHEMRVLRVLEEHGIPVPHVYGFCPEPRGIVMACAPGRVNLATAESEAERIAVLDHYVQILVRMHGLDVAAFEKIGLERPKTARALGLIDFDTWEREYRKHKTRPEPAIEFMIGWVRRNVPTNRERVSFISADSGQFLFQAGRVTALIDLELACLGDPAADLGGLRGRDLSEPLGDLNRAVRRYEELSGEPIDRRAIDFHTVRFGIVTPMAVSRLVANPPPGIDFVQYLCWYLVWTRGPLEVIADVEGTPLVAPELPAAAASTDDVATASVGARSDSYEADVEARRQAWSERRARLGPDLEAQDLDDAAALLGLPLASREEADRALEALVQSADPRRNRDLLQYFYRRTLRDEAIAKPLMRELKHTSMQLLR